MSQFLIKESLSLKSQLTQIPAFSLTLSLSFPGITSSKPSKLHRRAINLAKQSGLIVHEEKIVLSHQPVTRPLRRRHAGSLLRNIIVAAYTKEYVKPKSPFRSWITHELLQFKFKNLTGGTTGKKSIEIDLEKRYGSLKEHERLIHFLKGKLIGADYKIVKYRFQNADVDLPAEKRRTFYIFEAKAWSKKHVIQAARHAYGQLLWYMWNISKRAHSRVIGCVAFNIPPSLEVITFLEQSNGMCVVWKSGSSLNGGPKTKKVLKELF